MMRGRTRWGCGGGRQGEAVGCGGQRACRCFRVDGCGGGDDVARQGSGKAVGALLRPDREW